MAFGAPRCINCSGAVYHAEQAIGPAGKIYHKTCLKCESCGKRLDSGSLVEHDGLPYCARCHTQSFGTRDLRSANVHPASLPTTPSKTPARNSPLSPQQTYSPKPSTPRTLPPPSEYYTPPNLSSTLGATPDLPSRSGLTPSGANGNLSGLGGGPNGSNASGDSTPITRPNFREARPISVPYAGKLESFDERGLIRRNDSPRSKVGEKVLSDDMCWSCERRVYAAEQVMALGHKWHKGCLRCDTCKTSLDPGKLTDRNGVPKCKHCYAKEHGPEGILGKR